MSTADLYAGTSVCNGKHDDRTRGTEQQLAALQTEMEDLAAYVAETRGVVNVLRARIAKSETLAKTSLDKEVATRKSSISRLKLAPDKLASRVAALEKEVEKGTNDVLVPRVNNHWDIIQQLKERIKALEASQ